MMRSDRCKYLVLAYRSEEDCAALSMSEPDALLAQDQVLRQIDR